MCDKCFGKKKTDCCEMKCKETFAQSQRVREISPERLRLRLKTATNYKLWSFFSFFQLQWKSFLPTKSHWYKCYFNLTFGPLSPNRIKHANILKRVNEMKRVKKRVSPPKCILLINMYIFNCSYVYQKSRELDNLTCLACV